jgi:large subunit ribosomal protein L14e
VPLGMFSLGQLVQSIAGRDTGRIYLIVGFEPPARVWVADGRGRKTAGPKRKNIRHIRVLKTVDQAVATKIARGASVTDEDIRQAIRNCQSAGEY